MLKIALEAKDSVTRKLKQIDSMLKKANLDARKAKDGGDPEEVNAKQFWTETNYLKIIGKENQRQMNIILAGDSWGYPNYTREHGVPDIYNICCK